MTKKLTETQEQIKQAAERSLADFIRLVSPHRVLGSVHEELCEWWEREEAKTHQLTLLPRDHGKSAMVAYRVAWYIAKFPDIRILYISSTANLAEKQLKAIKDILTSKTFMKYWPDHIHPEEGKREKWTNSEISLDHPKRAEEGVRDPTVFTGGLTTSLTGMHCDIAVLDDVVVHENAYTQEGRTKVKSQYSLLSSIEGAEAREWVVGTRYHPKDLYSELMSMEQEIYDESGDITDREPIYEKFERAVEDQGDGAGEFLWPRQQRKDGKWFGFNREILSKKRGQYLDKTQFRAQYYNDPNSGEEGAIPRSNFQYYDKKFIVRKDGRWFYKQSPLNIFASIDFAFSLNKKADFTAITVIGTDPDNNTYVLDIDRFKTDAISEYFEHILDMHVKWDFRKLRAEVTSGQKPIVQELKNNYIKPRGLYLSVDEHRPVASQGSKEERINAILEPRYANLSVWHYRGGNCQVLEDELILQHPPHDDVKDALASAIEISNPPMVRNMRIRDRSNNIIYNTRFGGIAH
jgi:phage terminase large subunit-like protein